MLLAVGKAVEQRQGAGGAENMPDNYLESKTGPKILISDSQPQPRSAIKTCRWKI